MEQICQILTLWTYIQTKTHLQPHTLKKKKSMNLQILHWNVISLLDIDLLIVVKRSIPVDNKHIANAFRGCIVRLWELKFLRRERRREFSVVLYARRDGRRVRHKVCQSTCISSSANWLSLRIGHYYKFNRILIFEETNKQTTFLRDRIFDFLLFVAGDVLHA